jgi:hypothetical protein
MVNGDPPVSHNGSYLRVGHEVDEGVRQRVDEIAGDHADLAMMVACDVARQSVDEDAELGRLEGGHLLGEQVPEPFRTTTSCSDIEANTAACFTRSCCTVGISWPDNRANSPG